MLFTVTSSSHARWNSEIVGVVVPTAAVSAGLSLVFSLCVSAGQLMNVLALQKRAVVVSSHFLSRISVSIMSASSLLIRSNLHLAEHEVAGELSMKVLAAGRARKVRATDQRRHGHEFEVCLMIAKLIALAQLLLAVLILQYAGGFALTLYPEFVTDVEIIMRSVFWTTVIAPLVAGMLLFLLAVLALKSGTPSRGLAALIALLIILVQPAMFLFHNKLLDSTIFLEINAVEDFQYISARLWAALVLALVTCAAIVFSSWSRKSERLQRGLD